MKKYQPKTDANPGCPDFDDTPNLQHNLFLINLLSSWTPTHAHTIPLKHFNKNQIQLDST